MNYVKTKEGILLKNATDFKPEHIFECGQCFRWNRTPSGGYEGIAGGRVLRVKRIGKDMLLSGAGERDFIKYWAEYFDLGRDYGSIKDRLSVDFVLKKAVQYGDGIRVLKQDVWETLISFIISANNNIPRIKNIIERLCYKFGESFVSNGKTYYDFPGPSRLAAATEGDLYACGCGYRARYILQSAIIVARGRVDLYGLQYMDNTRARDVLMGFPGIGPKVADCIMLFAMAKFDVFPVDLWIKRVMEYYYLKKDTPLTEIRKFAEERFGPLAGIAQQYLFYYARENMAEVLKGGGKYRPGHK